jgi:hypothetical protein
MKKIQLILIALLLVLGAQSAYAYRYTFNSLGGVGSGTYDDPYLIRNDKDWERFSQCGESHVSWDDYCNDPHFTDKYVKLVANIHIYRAASDGYGFMGHFDGNGYTITSHISKTSIWSGDFEGMSVFRFLSNGAVVENLHVNGDVTSTQKYLGGLVGIVSNNSTVVIRNCRVSTNVSAWWDGWDEGNNKDKTMGGILGYIQNDDCNVTIQDCVFDGSLSGMNASDPQHDYSDYNSGLVGYKNGTLSLVNCLFSPSSIVRMNTSHCKTLARYDSSSGLKIMNCYYTRTMGDAQGTNASGMSVEALVNALGANWQEQGGKAIPVLSSTENFGGSGTEADPYRITSAANWNALARRVSNGDSFYGKYFKLTNDISVTTMIGTPQSKFRGIFQGAGRSINVNYSTTADFCGPFRYLSHEASIRNLTVTGTITSSAKYAGGIAGYAEGKVYFDACRSSVTINGTTDGDGSHGGLLGEAVGSDFSDDVYFWDCLFDGRLIGTKTDKWGGFIGWVKDEPDAYLYNCLFDPTEISVKDNDNKTFCRGSDIHLDKCYYTRVLGSTQGSDGRNKSASELVSLLGQNWMVVANKAINKPKISYPAFSGSGTSGNPYIIATPDDWDHLAIDVLTGNNYAGKYFRLANNIEVNRMIGTYDPDYNTGRSFCGNFDGNGKILTVHLNGSGTHIAPFSCLDGVTIKNLHIDGTVTTTGTRPAGLAGFVSGNVYIENCDNTVAISSSHNGEINAGAYVSRINSKAYLYFKGCTFLGSITYSNSNGYGGGGFVGYNKSNANLKNCLFAPTSLTIKKYDSQARHYMFVGGSIRATLSNCYYNALASDYKIGTSSSLVKEGKLMHTITPGNYVTIAMNGTAVPYNVSGITAYSNNGGTSFYPGFIYGDVIYAGNGDTVNLLLSFNNSDVAYTATSGTLTGNGHSGTNDAYTLIMTDNDVTILGNGIIVLMETNDNQTTIDENNGQTRTVRLIRTLEKGVWNSFSVPFAIPAATLTSVLGADVKVKKLTASALSEEGALSFTFETVTAIEAGKPYLIMPSSEYVDPQFPEVTFNKTVTTTETTAVNFVPAINPTPFMANDKSILFITVDGKLASPSKSDAIKGFRAYFKIK